MMNNRRQNTKSGSRISSSKPIPGKRQFRPGRVTDSISALKYQERFVEPVVLLAKEIDYIFFQYLVDNYNVKTDDNFQLLKDVFLSSYNFFVNDLYQNEAKHDEFRSRVSTPSFIEQFDFMVCGDQEQSELSQQLIDFAGIHLGFALIALDKMNRKKSNYGLISQAANSVMYISSQLQQLQNILIDKYKQDLTSSTGVKNLLSGVFDDNRIEQQRMKALSNKLEQHIKEFKASIVPQYQSAIMYENVKAVSTVPHKVLSEKRRRKKKVPTIYPEQPELLLKPLRRLGDKKSELDICGDVKNKKIQDETLRDKLPQNDSNDLPIYHPLEQALDSDGDDKDIARPISLLQQEDKTATQSHVAKLLYAPSLTLAGAAFGFIAGVMLAPYTGGSSLLLAIPMIVLVGGSLGVGGYFGGKKLDEEITRCRQLDLDQGKKTTQSICEKLDITIDSAHTAASKKLDSVAKRAKKLISGIKVFEAVPPRPVELRSIKSQVAANRAR